MTLAILGFIAALTVLFYIAYRVDEESKRDVPRSLSRTAIADRPYVGADEEWADELRALPLSHLDPERRVDELGEWYPGEAETVPPYIFLTTLAENVFARSRGPEIAHTAISFAKFAYEELAVV